MPDRLSEILSFLLGGINGLFSEMLSFLLGVISGVGIKVAVVVDRKAAMKAKELLETPDQARARVAAGGPTPAHYVPTPPTGEIEKQTGTGNPYR